MSSDGHPSSLRQRQFSVGSERELDDLRVAQSGTSTDLEAFRQIRQAMAESYDHNDDDYLDNVMFRPGTSKPPHHHHHGEDKTGETKHRAWSYSGHEVREGTEDQSQQPSPSKTTDQRNGKKNNSQWSIEASERSDTSPLRGSPLKTSTLPEVETVKTEEVTPKGGNSEDASGEAGPSRGPRYSSQRSYSEMMDNMSGHDPFKGEYQPSGKSKPSKIPKKKKHKHEHNADSIPLSHVTRDTDQEPKKLKKKRSHHHKHQGSESMNSTATYVVDGGVDNDGFENTGKSTKKGSKNTKIVEDRVSNATYTLSDAEQDSFGLKESFTKFMKKVDTVKMPSKDSKSSNSMSERTVANFISRHIKQRECKKYARNKHSSTNGCQCGRPIKWHEDQDMDIKMDSDREIWAMKTHTRTMPCDSFGEVLFQGFGHDVSNSPYVRLDPITELEDIWTILTDLWDLPIPKLLISVTGGAKRFDLKPRLRNLLKEGLCHAATSTGAWIITGGTSTGVMEFVGEAVRDHIAASGNPDQSKVVALGIATWGIVANKFALDGEGDRGLFPAMYTVKDVEATGSGTTALDHNHTHFILVDDGTEGKYGAEIKLRTKLESYISQKVETGVAQSQSVHVPNVLIVVEGGVNTMKTVSESIQRKTPVVVIEGSGRAAEYIAVGYKLTKGKDDEEKTVFPPDFDSIMLSKASSMFVWKKSEPDLDKKLHECLRNLHNCLEQRRLINVFNLENADSNKDIDRAILYALLKANKSNANSQLALALAWNRCDIARQEIFVLSNRKHWQKVNMYDAMVTAMVQDRADFVQLFLDNGLDIKCFLTIKTLWNLYANVINDMGDTQSELIRNLLAYYKQTWAAYLCCQGATSWQQSSDLLRYIGKVIMHLLRDQAMCLYSDDKYLVSQSDGPSMSWMGDENKLKPLMTRISTQDNDGQLSSRRTKLKFREEFDFTNPEREIFLWAVLFNRRKMAHLFWRIGRDHLMSGLVACSLLKMMADVADDEEELELSADLQDHAVVFEKQALNVLSECYSRDKRVTHQLLVCEQREWGGSTIFSLADAHILMDFVEHTACQTKLNDIWKGRMALYTPELKIVMTILFPILLPFIKFTSNNTIGDMLEGDHDDDEEYIEDGGETPGRASEPSSGKANQVDPGLDDDEPEFTRARSRRKKSKKTKLYSVNLMDFSSANINIFTAIFYFYAAPVTKFYCNVGSYLTFLFIFSYFVLIDLYPTSVPDSPSKFEIITWVWLATMLLEEGRQIFIRDQRSFSFKIQSWFSSVWNRFDLLIYSLFLVSIILRYNLFTSNFLWARMSYSITLAFFYLRFMQFFFASKNMGPKVIMIRKMLTDLLFFFFILLVFVISFGVAYHVNLYPNHIPSYKVLVNILYLPYFQMYGELFLERIEGEDDPADCTRNETLWRNDLAPRCPEPNALVSVLLAVYMILTNILLVNLLIAMFSYTFQTVQDNSQKIWRFFRLSLVYEYFDRPTLVPPIIFLNHLYRVVMWIFNRSCQNCKKLNSFKEKLEEKDYHRLRIFEKAAMESYLSRSRMQRREQLDSRVATTADRIETVMYELALIKENVMESGTRGLTAEQVQQLSLLGNMAEPAAAHRPSTGETAYLRQCVDDLTEQMGQHTLKLSQMMHLMEQMVGSQTHRSDSQTSHRHGSQSQAGIDGLTISEVSPQEEDA